jgi:hypothetical protein
VPWHHLTPVKHHYRQVQWRCTPETYLTFLNLWRELNYIGDDDSDESLALKDAIKGLPGHPVGFDPRTEIIVPINTRTGEPFA